MAEIRVRVETGMLGKGVGEKVSLELTPLVQAAIDDGRLTVLEQPAGAEPPVLKGAALDQALKDRNLSTSGTADEKRARLAETPPGGQEEDDEEVTPPLGGAVPGPAGAADARTPTAAPTDQT